MSGRGVFGTKPLRAARVLWGAALVLLAMPVGSVAQEAKDEKAGTPPSAESSPPEPTWYAQAVSRGEQGSVVSHFWSKGSKFRAEIVIGGHRIVTLVNGEYYYTLDELSGTGVGIRRAPSAIAEDRTRIRPFGLELDELLSQGAERIKSQELGGRTCDLYRVTDELGRRSVCADSERRLPIHVERYYRSSGSREEVSYLSWLAGFAMPDRYFTPDPRFEVELMSLEDYARRSRRGPVGPAPPLHSRLLFGKRGRR